MGRSQLWALLVLVPVLAACVKSQPTESGSTIVTTRTVAAPADTGPVDVRPTIAANADGCPILAQQTAAGLIGMRLARIQVLRQGGATVGCRFYALQDSPLATSEHLPGPNQPVLQIASSTFASSIAAHNALARLADAGTDPAQYPIGEGVTGVAYRARFDPADGSQDWAIGFSKTTKLVVISTAVNDSSADALAIAQAVVSAF